MSLYQIDFTLPGLPRMINATNRSNWRVGWQEGKQWSKMVGFITAGKRPPKPLVRAKAFFLRSTHGVEPDFDNLVISFKPVRDALKSCGIIVDDKPSHFRATYEWQKGVYRQGFIQVQVTEVSEEEWNSHRSGSLKPNGSSIGS